MQAVRFGRFEFDLESLELREHGSPMSLQPKPPQVLSALLARPGRLVSRGELRATVWRDRVIEFDAGLNFSILPESCAPTGRNPGAIGSHA